MQCKVEIVMAVEYSISPQHKTLRNTIIKYWLEFIYGESSGTIRFDIEWPWNVKVKVI